MNAAATLANKVRTLARLLRQGQFLRILVLAANTWPPSILHVSVVVITRTRRIPTLRRPTHVRFRQLRADEPLTQLPERDSQDQQLLRARMRRELDSGCEVFVAETDGRIIGYVWVARRHLRLAQVRLEVTLDANEACTYRAYVEPAYRYSWVYPGLVTFALTQLHQRGHTAVLGHGNLMNRHSIRTHERLGFHRVGWVALIRLLGIDLQVTRLAWRGDGIRCHVLRRGAPPPAAEPAMVRAPELPSGGTDGGFAR